jgi:hypothetical protein
MNGLMWPSGEPNWRIVRGRLPTIFQGGVERFPSLGEAEAILPLHIIEMESLILITSHNPLT